jgi:hypothetical protein
MSFEHFKITTFDHGMMVLSFVLNVELASGHKVPQSSREELILLWMKKFSA